MIRNSYGLVLTVLLWLPFLGTAQHSLSIRVDGVASSKGTLQVAVYTQEKDFLKVQGVYRRDSIKAKSGSNELVLEGLPSGDYAIAMFHAENDNEQLDKNWAGIPKEPLGFSNARMKTFGPPSFEDCRIHLQKNAHVVIEMN